MLMPEATMHKHRLLPFSEDDVRSTRDVPRVQPVAIAHAVQETADH